MCKIVTLGTRLMKHNIHTVILNYIESHQTTSKIIVIQIHLRFDESFPQNALNIQLG